MVSAVAWAQAGALALLACATAVAAVLSGLHPERSYAELRLRIRTWWLIVIGFFAAISFSHAALMVALAVTSYFAFREFILLASAGSGDSRLLRWAPFVIALQYLWAWLGWHGMFITFIPVYVLLLLPASMALAGETRNFLRPVAVTQWGFMLTVYGLSHLAFLPALPHPDGAHYDGASLLFFVVFLTAFNDAAQYVWGKCFGRRRVIAAVSPNKTCEGLLGGIATTTLVAWLVAPLLTPLDGAEAAAAGLMIGVAGFVGDIVVSAMKREAGVKDTGTSLPGHGGVLDRVDSLIFTAPLFFHGVRYLHY